MRVYLARHGEAIPKEIDSECPLSEKGNKDLQKMVGFLLPCKLQVDFFFHSGKLRAKQTAELLAQGLYCPRGVEARSGLNPSDPVSPLVNEINQFEHDLALVGHLPFMEKLLSTLLVGNENADLLLFQTAVLVCLEQMDNKNWIIKWALSPDLFS